MGTGEQMRGRLRVPDDEGRVELARLLGDDRFHGTERAKCILRYLAERRFQGCDEAVKAYSIALDVLGRHSDFNAATDPIVRIEISRLRSCLGQYYEAFGGECEVSISLPVGRYVAEFSYIDDDADAPPPGLPEPRPERSMGDLHNGGRMPLAAWRPRFALSIIGGVVLAVGICGAAGAAWFYSRPVLTMRPSVALSMSSPQGDNAAEADATADYLVAALSKFRTLNISSQKDMTTASTASGMRASAGSSYHIDMRYYADGDDRTVWWQIVDDHGGGILKSGVDKVDADGRGEAAVRDELVSALAKRFASTRGVINVLESHVGGVATALGNSCVLRAEFELDEGGRNGIRSVVGCLEKTVDLQPGNADALAVLSRVLVAAEGGDPATTQFDRALSLANKAATIDPPSDRAQVAIMMAQFYFGRTEAAIAAGNQALALNPNDPDVLSKLASVLYSAGYDEAGVALARDAGKGVDIMPRDARIVLALDAYGRGDYANASLLSEQINCGDIVVRAIRAASLGQMASPGAGASLAYLREILPDYESSLTRWMAWRRYPAPVVASLELGLAKAKTAKVTQTGAVASVN